MKLAFRLALAASLLASAPVAAQPAIPLPAPRLPASSWRQVLEAPHPRLLGPRDDLRALARAKPELYAEIKSPDSIRDSIMAAGVVTVVEENGISDEQARPYIEAAMVHLKRGATNAHQDSWIWMQEVVLAYDFFHARLSPAQRAAMIEWLNLQLASFKDDENAFHNSIQPKILTYLRVAYATRGENPRANEFRDYALKYLYEERMAPVLREFGAGGGMTEAAWYARGALWYLVQALELARRVEGYDGFALAPRFFYQRLALGMFESYPGAWLYGSERFPVEGDGSYLYGGNGEAGRHVRAVLAGYFRGSELSRLASHAIRRGKGSNGAARLMNFLYHEEPPEPLPLEQMPLAHLASGIGSLYARSDWGDDATWFRFNAGDYWTGHQHLDVGHFEIFHREPLATESGEYIDYGSNHSINYLLRTVAHNCILVRQPDEKFPLRGTFRDGGRNQYANDGGQTKTWEWPVGTLEEWQAKKAEFERADITAYENQAPFLFVAADLTRAYNPSKLKSWTRQIVYLRPGTFVILDRVSSTKAEYEKAWLLHSSGEPSLAGPQIVVEAGEGERRGRLSITTLLPAATQTRKVKGYEYGGQKFEEAKSGQSDAAPQWRLEVLPSRPATDDVFLHVLSTDANPATPRLIRNGQQVGVAVGGSQVLFAGETGGEVTIGGRKYLLRAGVKAGKFE